MLSRATADHERGRSRWSCASESLIPLPSITSAVVEQRAVAVGSGPQLLEQIGEHRDVIGGDLAQLSPALRIVAVMREGVVRVGDADLRIGAARASRANWKVKTRVMSA